ncbi:MAG: SLC26A/SulP transporter family protein [Planctomycetota bacterium]|nr:SLC26A/SulP transporter family protein [Planctomycetota bacterium]
MLVALPSSVAFGVLTYSMLGPQYIGMGAMAGLVGAVALGLVAPFVGRTGGLISCPCAPASAVLTAMIAKLAGDGLTPDRILPLMAVTALFSGALQVLYGLLGGGRLIKYIPFPVVSGYLSGVGVLIALGQLPKILGLPKNTPLAQGLVSPGLWRWESLGVGAVTIALVFLAPKLTKKVPAAIVGLAGGIAAYQVLTIFFPALRTLQGNELVIGPIETGGAFLDLALDRLRSIGGVDLAAAKLMLIPALTLSVLLSVDTLKSCVALDTMMRVRHNSNRELIAQGAGNLCSFLAGGMPGAGAMGPSLVNVTSGGRTPRAGVIEGVFVLLALLLLGPLIAWVPIGALAGILIVVAWNMFDRGMFRLLRTHGGRSDFAVIAAVIAVAIFADLIAATGVGVALAILLFMRDLIRASVVRNKLTLAETSSKTRRPPALTAALKEHGGDGVLCELQGNLFFGTTDQLYTQLEPDLKARKYILLDLRRVDSLDYTAAHLFERMNAQLEEHGGRLLFSGMPSTLSQPRDFERYLVQLGVVSREGGVLLFETQDAALEWMEDRILEAQGLRAPGEAEPLPLEDFELFHGLGTESLAALAACVEERAVPAGAKAFAFGDAGDELLLVRSGSIRILLPLEGGKNHHLATIGRGNFFGELAFLDGGTRSADAEAKADAKLYVLSRARLQKHFERNETLTAKVFARLASAIGTRLRQADAELRALSER